MSRALFASRASGRALSSPRARPVVVGPVSDALDVETHPFEDDEHACSYTCARTEGLVYCWGCNRFASTAPFPWPSKEPTPS